MNKLNYNYFEKLGIFLFIISIIYLIISSYIGIFEVNMWYDELYSLNMAKMPLSSMITAGSNNVHPLLYYFILKIFSKLFNLFGLRNLEIVGVIVSLIPFYLLLTLSFTKIKNNFGLLCSGIFSLCIISMPQLLRYSIEVRMYGWAILILTASYIYIYEINKEPKLIKWVILTILTILACYTHYFAAVALFSLYLVFLLYILSKKRELLKNWLLSASIAVLAYIPWMPSLINQIHNVHKSYWIEPISIKTIISYFYYIFSPFHSHINGNAIISPDILGSIMLLCFLALIIYYIKDNNEKLGNYPLYGLIAVILVPTIGVSVSIIYSPIFFMRYLIPILGILWLCFSIFLDNIKDKTAVFSIIIAFILIIGAINAITFINSENTNFNNELEQKEIYNQNIPNGSIIIYDGFNSYITSMILDNNYTTVYLENLKQPWKAEQLWKSNPSKYMDKILHKKAIENKKDNINIFIVDKNDKYSELKKSGYDLDIVYNKDNLKIYKLNS